MKILGIPVVLEPSCAEVARARGFWPAKRIEVGPAWYALPPEERVAVLYHEAHHCRAFHLEARLLLLPLVFLAYVVMTISRRQEIAADRRAIAHGWGEPMARYLRRANQPESHFYPSSSERVAEIRRYQEASCKP